MLIKSKKRCGGNMAKKLAENVAYLCFSERINIKHEALDLLQIELGTEASRDVIERATLELSDRIWLVEQAILEENFNEAARIAESTIAIAEQIGLSDLMQSASCLVQAINCADYTSIYAVSLRYSRVGEASLKQAVEIAEQAV